MADKMTRWAKIVNYLCSRNNMTIQRLIEECEIGERTIYRDLDKLKKAGYPIQYNESGRNYYINEKQFSLRMLSLNDTEVVALLQCIDAFNQEGFPFSGALSLIKEKLQLCLPEERRKIIQQKMGVIEIDIPEPVEIPDSIFNLLIQGSLENRSVKISYSSAAGEVSYRKIDPYGLIFKQSVWYLVAYCHLRQKIRLFRSDRIAEIELSEERFVVPEDFILETFFDSSWAVGQGEEIHVQLKFSPVIAADVKKAKYHPNQKMTDQPDGSVLYEVTVRGLWEISRWVLSFGPAVEVLEPKELRKNVRDMIDEMRILYKL
jgi:predicted DNA-binding transcriptional regulator YafY